MPELMQRNRLDGQVLGKVEREQQPIRYPIEPTAHARPHEAERFEHHRERVPIAPEPL
jgi:hypothetical protein